MCTLLWAVLAISYIWGGKSFDKSLESNVSLKHVPKLVANQFWLPDRLLDSITKLRPWYNTVHWRVQIIEHAWGPKFFFFFKKTLEAKVIDVGNKANKWIDMTFNYRQEKFVTFFSYKTQTYLHYFEWSKYIYMNLTKIHKLCRKSCSNGSFRTI